MKNLFNKHNKVKILAILGDSTGINVENDRQILSQLQQAETTFLVQPSREELFSQLWQEEGWDIFFFSGHSESNEDDYTGYIYLNQQEKLSIGQLKNAVEKAQNNGLQLAIFNSCDGLGLGKELADLSIPETILMREPVADQVAQKFLEYFLTIFSSGQSLYLSVKEARKRLQGIENNFPGASWLPVIWQNPATIPFLWRDLCFNSQTLKRRISKILSVCLGILTLLFNWLGFKPNSAKAEEILANNSPENLANYLQQQSLDLQQLSDYLVEEDSNNIPLFESNLVQSLQQISEQLKTNQIPSLSQINQIQNELKQINSNLLLEDENRLLTDTEIENTSNPNISQFQPENQTSQNNNNFNNDNNPIENESKISFQLDDNEKVNNDNLIADLVETIENNLKQINTEIEEINNQLDDFNQSQNLSLDNLGETEIKLQKYEQQLAENFEDNLEIMKNFAESITALDNFNNIELSLGKEKDMQLENLVINFSNLSHNWQSKSENISQNCNSLTDYISVTITDNKSIFINTVLSQLSQSLNNYQPKVNEIILLLESQKLEINNLFEQILDSKINWYKEYFSQTKIKIVNNLHKKYNWFIEENFTFHQVLANNNDRLVIITTNLPKKTENLSMLGDKIKREIVADNFLIFPDYAKISEQLFLISDNLANISNLSTKVNLQLEVFN